MTTAIKMPTTPVNTINDIGATHVAAANAWVQTALLVERDATDAVAKIRDAAKALGMTAVKDAKDVEKLAKQAGVSLKDAVSMMSKCPLGFG